MTGNFAHLPKLAGLAILAAALAIAPVVLRAETTQPVDATALSKDNKQPKDVNIEADAMEILQDKKQAIFTGKVWAKRGDTTLNCDKLVVDYVETPVDSSTDSSKKSADKSKKAKADKSAQQTAGTQDAAADQASATQAVSTQPASTDQQPAANKETTASTSQTNSTQKDADPAASGDKKTEVTFLNATGNVTINDTKQTITGEWAKLDVKGNKLTVGGNVVIHQGKSVLHGNQLFVNLKTNQSQLTGGRVKGSFVPQQ